MLRCCISVTLHNKNASSGIRSAKLKSGLVWLTNEKLTAQNVIFDICKNIAYVVEIAIRIAKRMKHIERQNKNLFTKRDLAHFFLTHGPLRHFVFVITV